MVDPDGLARRAAAGDRASLERLLEALKDDAWRFLYRMCGSDRDLADDLLQDTLIAAYTGIRRFRGDSTARTWLLGIAMNVLRGSQRRRALDARRRRTLAGMRQLDEGSTEPVGVTVTLGDRINVAFASLARGQREALYLYEILGCTVAETARVLGISTDAVKNRLYNGRARLREAVRGSRASSATDTPEIGREQGHRAR